MWSPCGTVILLFSLLLLTGLWTLMVSSNYCFEKLRQLFFFTINCNWCLTKSIRDGTPCSQIGQEVFMVKWQGCNDILDTERHINFSHYCDKMPGRRILKENSFYLIYSSCLIWWRRSVRLHISEEHLTSQQVRKQMRPEAGKF